MKMMIASDIHGSLTATRQLINIFHAIKATWLILLGDFLNHGPRNPLPEDYRPTEVALLLNAYSRYIIAVHGNCDSEVDQTLLDFPITASWQQILLDNKRLFLTHGHLYHPAKLPALLTGDTLLYGHTHIPQAEQLGEHILFNPGSVSLPKGGFPPSYGLLKDERLWVISLLDEKIIAQVVITN